ncbi:DUF4209 domain-containing protein [Bacillus sp. KeR2]|uniref:DUF4209 domain-containing protein n=1 Tax=Bacillus sp. KeR2 TaxID=2994533 RepID=UPI00224B6D27|nr:DUF4209 domain-containing protein [Bacillus sp. KeR2]MCX2851380.1 DUF4209 domain-containing protein [Bacillus sp. KeR2]
MTNFIDEIKLTESNIDEFKWDLSAPFLNLKSKLEEQDVDRKSIADIEKDILVLDLETDRETKGFFTHRYAITEEQGRQNVYPNIEEQFTEEIKTYLIRRTMEVRNPILKARYNDVLWSIYKSYPNTKDAIEGYLQCSRIFYDKDWIWLISKTIDRALQIAIGIKDSEQVLLVIEVYKDILTRAREENKLIICIDLANSLMNYHKALKNYGFNFVECVIPFLLVSEEHSADKSEFELKRKALSVIVSIYNAEKNKELEEEHLIEIAKSYESEGDWNSVYEENYIIASENYEESMNILLHLGNQKTKVDELKVKIQESNKKGILNFLKFEQEIKIPTAILEPYFKIYNEISDSEIFLANLSIDSNLLPDWQKSIEFARTMENENPLLHLMPKKIFSGNIAIKEVKSDQEKLNYEAIRSFALRYQTCANIFIIKLFEIFKCKFQYPDKEIIDFLNQSELIEKRMPVIGLGIKRYFEEDYIGACHLLIFQIEGILREMLGLLKLPTFSYRNNEMKERLLSDCLDTLKNKGIEKNFIKFLQIFLCENMGDNLRNEFAHGIADIAKMNQVNASLLLLTYLKLSQYRLTEVKPME